VVPAVDLGERLWRARRRHHHVDAVVRTTAAGCELQFFHDNRLMVTWPFADRGAAMTEASARLAELQRAGWTVHW
jgi:hypothetical protein